MAILPRQSLNYPTWFLKELQISLSSKTFYKGSFTKKFADQLSKYMGVKYTTFCSSARGAIKQIVTALDIKKEDEVLVPAFTYYAVPATLASLNIKPVFVDITKNTLSFNPKLLEKSITKKTKAILVTHLFGIPADIQEIKKIATKHKLKLIEDIAQGFGASVNNKMLGSFGDVSFTSFSITKPIKTFGGGAIFTNSKNIFQNLSSQILPKQSKASLLKTILVYYTNSILTNRYIYPISIYPVQRILDLFTSKDVIYDLLKEEHKQKKLSAHYRSEYTDFQAKIGYKQFKRSIFDIKTQIKTSKAIQKNIDSKHLVSRSRTNKNSICSYWQLPILVDDKQKVASELLRRGIDIQREQSHACPYMEMFKTFKRTEYPVAKHIESQIIYIPNYTSLKEKDIHCLNNSLNEVLK